MVIQRFCSRGSAVPRGPSLDPPSGPQRGRGKGRSVLKAGLETGQSTSARMLWPKLVARPTSLQKGWEFGLGLRGKGGGLASAAFTPLEGVNIMRYACKMPSGDQVLMTPPQTGSPTSRHVGFGAQWSPGAYLCWSWEPAPLPGTAVCSNTEYKHCSFCFLSSFGYISNYKSRAWLYPDRCLLVSGPLGWRTGPPSPQPLAVLPQFCPWLEGEGPRSTPGDQQVSEAARGHHP